MTYQPLVQFNPTQDDVTINSSYWLASRLNVGMGITKICFPFYLSQNNAAMRVISISDIVPTNDNYLIQIDTAPSNPVKSNILSSAYATNLEWKGCWTLNGKAIIGHVHTSFMPFNKYNIGYRYKRGWRPEL